MDTLFQLIKKYVSPDKYMELRHDLGEFFAGNQEEKHPVLKPDVWRLTDFLTEDRVVFLDRHGRNLGEETLQNTGYDKLSDWERALYTTAAPLLKRGSIEEHYVQCIIERLEEAGPYMFVTKDLILAHARPENGVKHLDFALGIVPEGIPFNDEKTARIIFLLVVEDQQKHMGILQDIRKALAKKQQVDELTATVDSHKVCEILWSRLMDS